MDMKAWRTWGLGRIRHLLDLHVGVPSLEHGAQFHRELKTDLGLGAHQVSGEERRIENSFGIAVLAYLLLIRACHQEILPGTSWSVSQLQHAFRLRVITNQVAHNVKSQLAKARKVA
jgi:hypothetical protein